MSEKEYDVLSEVHSVEESLNELIQAHTEELPVAKERGNDEFMVAVDAISKEVANHVQDTSLITKSDLAKLKKSQAFLFQTYTDVRQYRPMINKLTTVLSSEHFPTIDSKFWQCKSEAEVHFNELQRDTFKWQRARIDLDELDYKIESIERMLEGELTPVDNKGYDPNLVKFDLKRLQVKRSQYEFEVKQLEKSIKYRIEEVTDWAVIADSFEPKLKYNSRDPDEHIAENKLYVLEHLIQNAESEEQKAMFKGQLETLKHMIAAKTQQIKQERGA